MREERIVSKGREGEKCEEGGRRERGEIKGRRQGQGREKRD